MTRTQHTLNKLLSGLWYYYFVRTPNWQSNIWINIMYCLHSTHWKTS